MKSFPIICFLGLTLSLAGCSNFDSQTKQWLGTGDKAESLDAIAKPGEDGVNATLEKQAVDALQKGDIARASQFYEQLLGSQKSSKAEILRYQIGYAECLRRLGETDKALAAYDEILGGTPDAIEAQEGRALTLMAMGKATDAGRAFADIMKRDSKRWRTLNALGILFVTKNMIPESNAYFTEALTTSPDNPAVLNNAGLAQAVDKQYARAIATLEQASRLAKSGERRRQIDLNMAMVYGASGDLDTARDIASKYLQGPALDNNLGLYAHLAKDDTLAKTYLNMALSGSNTFYERAWNNLEIVDQNTDGAPISKKK